MEDIVIIIPAYNPDEELVRLVEELNRRKFSKIVVINDGSKLECNQYFDLIKDKCYLLKNNENKGKGNALKKVFNFLRKQDCDFKAVVTVDADGQHCVEDVNNIANKLRENSKNGNEKIILGSRNFYQKKIPIKNKIGNRIGAYIFRKTKKMQISDTQSGLRGIPLKYLKDFENIQGERYEYEQNCLNYIAYNHIPYEEVFIKTIYKEKQKSSFRIIKDTYRVIRAFLNLN